MKQTARGSVIRKMAVLILFVLLCTGAAASVQAATYPTASIVSYPKTLKRGKKGNLKFYLQSGSYTRTSGGIWRAEFDLRIYNKKGKMVAWNGKDGDWFTGRIYYTMKWKPKKSLAKGRYKVVFRTYFNNYTGSYRWMYNNYTTNRYFYIQLK